jgi:hypothetical protein
LAAVAVSDPIKRQDAVIGMALRNPTSTKTPSRSLPLPARREDVSVNAGKNR